MRLHISLLGIFLLLGVTSCETPEQKRRSEAVARQKETMQRVSQERMKRSQANKQREKKARELLKLTGGQKTGAPQKDSEKAIKEGADHSR